MSGGETIRQSLEILFNYWETPVSQLSARLDELVRRGVTHIASFVPWQAAESDISQHLTRFILATSERRISVSLILTPEVGVHYPNSGLPKDLISKAEGVAKDSTMKPVTQVLAPNLFHLPSLLSQDFSKRYSNFLTRMDGVLSDLARNHNGSTELVTAVLTGSYWKYYRAPKLSSLVAFGGISGDFSSHASLAYRSRIEHFYSQSEFSAGEGSHTSRWKNRALEETNRKWFATHCEEVFKNRTHQLFGRRCHMKIEARELYTPEADPAYFYTQILQGLSGGKADFFRFSKIIDEYVLRASNAPSGASMGWVHFSDFGGFQNLADNEKQFLILKSILAMGGRSGGVLLDENVWFSMSNSFRAKTQALMQMVSSGELFARNYVYYWTTNLWSDIGEVGDELVDLLGSKLQISHSIDRFIEDEDTRIAFVDAGRVHTEESMKKLTAWVNRGNIAVLPKAALFSETCREWIQSSTQEKPAIQMNLGIPYQIFNLGGGKIVFFDQNGTPPAVVGEVSGATAAPQTLRAFLESMLALAQVRKNYGVSDLRLTSLELERKTGGTALFILNPTLNKLNAEIFFEGEVSISDLTGSAATAIPATRFAIDVPPCGLIPLAVHGMGEVAVERKIAAENEVVLRENVAQAARNELAGYTEEGPSVWN